MLLILISTVMRFHWAKNLRGGAGFGFNMPESWMKKEQLFEYSPYFHAAAKRRQDLGGSGVRSSRLRS
jgi:hypothetical protein